VTPGEELGVQVAGRGEDPNATETGSHGGQGGGVAVARTRVVAAAVRPAVWNEEHEPLVVAVAVAARVARPCLAT